MSVPCPTCGQHPLPGNRTAELLALLRTPVAEKPSRHRQVYRIDRAQLWSITHSGSLPKFNLFLKADIERAVRAGHLAPVYPGTPAEGDAYGLSSHYGRPDYIREIKWQLEQRKPRKVRKVASM